MERPVIREEKKVILTLLREEDAEWMWREVNRRDTLPVMGKYGIFSVEEEKNFIQKAYEDKDMPRLLIVTKDGRRAGVIGVNAYDRRDGTAEIGYWLAHDMRGKGYAKEALSLFIDFLFTELNYRRLYAFTDVTNAASQRVLEANGFKREGKLRKHSYNGVVGDYVDVLVYGLLRREWERRRRSEDKG